MSVKLRDPMSAISHYIGAGLSLLAIVIVSLTGVFGFSFKTVDLVSTLIFTATMLLLYLASGIYHSVNVSDEKLIIFRKIDHSMIYLLIAGSYTPFLLALVNKKFSIGLMILVWGLAIAGIVLKVFFFRLPRTVSTIMYIALGWLVIFFIRDIAQILPFRYILLLALGGLSYSIGGVIYILKKPSFSKCGFHDIFHLFVLTGSLCQFFAVYFGILLSNRIA